MKTMNAAEMHAVNAGGTSYIKIECMYKYKGCKEVAKVSYNNSWWCKWWTKPSAQNAAQQAISLHQNRYCVYKYL